MHCRATGKYDVYTAGTPSAGAFTADAVLRADLVTAASAGTLSGMINNYQCDDDMLRRRAESLRRCRVALAQPYHDHRYG